MVVCKIKDWLKPLLSFLIPGRYGRWWVGDSWNGQVLRDIGKYQVQTGLDTGGPLVKSNFAFRMLSNKQAHPNQYLKIKNQKRGRNLNQIYSFRNLHRNLKSECKLLLERTCSCPKPYNQTQNNKTSLRPAHPYTFSLKSLHKPQIWPQSHSLKSTHKPKVWPYTQTQISGFGPETLHSASNSTQKSNLTPTHTNWNLTISLKSDFRLNPTNLVSSPKPYIPTQIQLINQTWPSQIETKNYTYT